MSKAAGEYSPPYGHVDWEALCGRLAARANSSLRACAPEKSAEVELPAEGQSFERWTAHPERSDCGA